MDNLKEVRVPDLGGSGNVPVIELLVVVGDHVTAGQALITLESDKATMEVPSSVTGVIRELRPRIGDTLSGQDVIAVIDVSGDTGDPGSARDATTQAVPVPPQTTLAPAARATAAAMPRPAAGGRNESGLSAGKGSAAALPGHAPYASPGVRQLARRNGVALDQIRGSGRGGRIVHTDVLDRVTNAPSGASSPPPATTPHLAAGVPDLPPGPDIDFTRFGAIELQPLSRIQKISAGNLARNWATIPHVTQYDQADVTDLDAFRIRINNELENTGVRITLLAFLIKASAAVLGRFPRFNASLDPGGEALVLKQYCHIGFAVDTPKGLLVPVIRDADRKGISEIARETAALASKARDGRLALADMQGGCFSISSLGGLGGTSFTPIINAPEVAILGVSKSSTQPVWDGHVFQPRLLLPLSLSYDHRVIDGAEAARFIVELGRILADFCRISL